jgi:ribose 5-phosphate isomerase A
LIWHRGFALSEPRTTADALAEAAVAPITSGMTVGLGSGRTASRGVMALAERVREENLDIRCVPTSHVVETLARSQGLNVVDFTTTPIEQIDFLFDGADAVDHELRMIKGGGGALVRERIVAHAAERRVYMVAEHKLVDRLTAGTTLPVAVQAFGLASTREHLRRMGLNGVVRRTLDGQLFLTDNANLVLDVTLEGQSPDELDAFLDSIPGIVDHGLFLAECDELLIESRTGIKKITSDDIQPEGGCGQGCGCHH